MNPHESTKGTSRSNCIGVVAIGRNEGERLRRCLVSVSLHAGAVVYVDSGSSDGSVGLAQSLGATTVNLDMSQPFTAARARNEGFRRLLAVMPTVEYVHFVDGDCEIAAGWFDKASAFLDARADVVAVCGRRRERFPDKSIYNRLCDIDWTNDPGQVLACGGDVLMRARAFEKVAGFREELIAGEEPELCIRLRAQGWLIWRLPDEMTLHDAAMTHFGQWWRRAVRTGYAFAEGAHLHGRPPERHWVQQSRSAWFWGLLLPLALLIGASVDGPLALWGFALYPIQILRLFLRARGPWRLRALQASFLVIGKFAEAAGQIRFVANRVAGRRAALIEYK